MILSAIPCTTFLAGKNRIQEPHTLYDLSTGPTVERPSDSIYFGPRHSVTGSSQAGDSSCIVS